MSNQLIHTQIRGYYEIQRARVQLLEAISPQGGLGEAVKQATLFLHEYAVHITPVVTGTLQSSHMIDFAAGGVSTYRYNIRIRNSAAGIIYINPLTVNPFTGDKPSEYGLVVHRRGGSRAFYRRTYEEAGPFALLIAHNIIWGRLPRGGRITDVVGSGVGVMRMAAGVLAKT